jgi:hypothetical protein
LVEITQLAPAWANLISSLSAAGVILLISRGRGLVGARGVQPTRVAARLSGIAVQALIISAVIGALAPLLAGEARLLGLAGVATLAAVVAKVIVTPAELALGFLAAEPVARRAHAPVPRRAEVVRA